MSCIKKSNIIFYNRLRSQGLDNSTYMSDRVKINFHSATSKIKNKFFEISQTHHCRLVQDNFACFALFRKRNWVCYQVPSTTRTKISESNVSYFMLFLRRSCLLFHWEHSFLWDVRRFANKLSSCLKKSRIQFPYKRNKTL